MASKVSQIATIFQQGGVTGGSSRDGSRSASKESLLSREGSLGSRENIFDVGRPASRDRLKEDHIMRNRSASTDSILSRDLKLSRDDLIKGSRSDSRDSVLSGERSLSREDMMSREGSKENILTSRESLISSRESLSSGGGYSRHREVPGPASVVRTESHLARFNNARAMFEKMSSTDKDQDKSRGSGSTTPTDGLKPSKLVCTPKAVSVDKDIHFRGLSSVENVKQQKGSTFSSSLSFDSAKLNGSSRKPVPLVPLKQQTNGHHIVTPAQNTQQGSYQSPYKTNISYSKSVPETSSSNSKFDSIGGHTSLNSATMGGSLGSYSSSAITNTAGNQCKSVRSPVPKSDVPLTLELSPAEPKIEITGGSCVRQGSNIEQQQRSTDQKEQGTVSPQHQQHKELVQRHKNWFQSFSKNLSSPTTSNSPSVTR